MVKDGVTPAEQGGGGYATKSASMMLFNIVLAHPAGNSCSLKFHERVPPGLQETTPGPIRQTEQGSRESTATVGMFWWDQQRVELVRQWEDAAPVLSAVWLTWMMLMPEGRAAQRHVQRALVPQDGPRAQFIPISVSTTP